MTRKRINFWSFSFSFLFGSLLQQLLAFPENEKCPSLCFCDSSASYVSCMGDGLQKVPQDLPAIAQRMELRDFDVITLPENMFSSLNDLQELAIQESRIALIEGGPFAHMKTLNRLDLSQNHLENITSVAFEGLEKLRYLDLSSNNLSHVIGAFLALSNVEQLNLRSNKIQYLDNQILKGLIRVQYLNLDYNHITRIEPDSFVYLSSLVHLTLSNNPIKALNRLDIFSHHIQYIDVTSTGLARVPQSLTLFVRDLRAAKNNISAVSAGDFDSYQYLALLVLDDNLISSIEKDALGRQDYLVNLWLNRNNLSAVPDELPPSLKSLHMDENNLETLPAYSFKGLTSLQRLFLQRNRIVNLSSCVFCDLNNLNSLFLQGNEIEHIFEGVFSNLSRLQTLDLSNNNIKVLDANCFHGLENLQAMHMSRISSPTIIDIRAFESTKKLKSIELFNSEHIVKQILSLTALLQSLRNIEEINIMHNNLVTIRSDIRSFFPNLKQIRMSDNTWECTEETLWLSNWIIQKEGQFFRSQSIKCATPERLGARLISSLTELDFPHLTLYLFNSSQSNYSNYAVNLTSSENDTEVIVEFSVENSSEELGSTTQANKLTPEYITTPRIRNMINPPFVNFKAKSKEPDHSFSSLPPQAILENKKRIIKEKGSTRTEQPSHFQRLFAPPPEQERGWSSLTTITVSTSLAGGCLIIMASVLVLFSIFRFRVPLSRKRCAYVPRRSNSISYCLQQDEVAILTVSENTVV